ncbi:hypothetical protein AVEN_265553-1 [Araneus ventricosus]|uniref:Uncharacterized protein n=1 Tax=Araneus ventricosus TaxID=182803 RepID=A0A4Y2WNH7_ARAVE|nr:hypothetical protein AVEN_265553-1 [Araneus ventricosus]
MFVYSFRGKWGGSPRFCLHTPPRPRPAGGGDGARQGADEAERSRGDPELLPGDLAVGDALRWAERSDGGEATVAPHHYPVGGRRRVRQPKDGPGAVGRDQRHRLPALLRLLHPPLLGGAGGGPATCCLRLQLSV